MSNLNDCSGFNKVNLDVKENWNNKEQESPPIMRLGLEEE